MNVRSFLYGLTEDERKTMETYRPLAGVTLVVTGALGDGLTRGTFIEWIERFGGTVVSEVRPSTDYLLAVDPDRQTLKRKEAARFGVTVLAESAFVKNVLEKAKAQAFEDKMRVLVATGPAVPIPDPTWFHSDDGVPAEEDFEDEIRPLGDYLPRPNR